MRNLYPVIFYWSCIIAAGMLLVARLFIIFDLNPDIGGIEEVFVHYTLRLYHHYPIYVNPEHEPFLNCQYTPFYFELVSRVLKLIHPSESELIRYAYIIGRTISLLANVLSSTIFVAVIFSRRPNARLLPIALGCLSFLFFTVHNYAFRPDSLKTLLVMAAFYFFTVALHSDKPRHLICSLFFAALAFFVKQDAVIFLAAASICFLIARPKWWPFILLSLAMSFLSFLLIAAHYGPYLTTNIFLGLHFKYSLIAAVFNVYILSIFRVLFLLIVISIFIRWLMTEKDKKQIALLLLPIIYFPAVVGLSFKFGAAPVYFTDLFLICLVVLIVLMPRVVQVSVLIRIIASLLVFLNLSFDLYAGNIYLYRPLAQSVFADYDADCKKVTQAITPITNENFYLFTFDKNLSNHCLKQALFASYETEFPQYLLTNFIRGNNKIRWQDYYHDLPDQIFGYQCFHADIASGKVKYLILNKGAEKPIFLNEDFRDFNIVQHTSYFDIYIKSISK